MERVEGAGRAWETKGMHSSRIMALLSTSSENSRNQRWEGQEDEPLVTGSQDSRHIPSTKGKTHQSFDSVLKALLAF